MEWSSPDLVVSYEVQGTHVITAFRELVEQFHT